MVSEPDGMRYPSVVFREVVAIERLVYGWDTQGSAVAAGEVTLTVTKEGGKTDLVQHFVGKTSDAMFPLMEQGTNEQLDKLAALVER